MPRLPLGRPAVLRLGIALGLLVVTSPLFAQSLMVSQSSDRSAAIPLAGATIAGDAYIFTFPDTGVNRVRFWLDSPDFAGPQDRVENNAPYDFAGGNSVLANAWDSNSNAGRRTSRGPRISLCEAGSTPSDSTW